MTKRVSTKQWHALFKFVHRLGRRALPGYCEFCLGPGVAGHFWCEACLHAMPWNEHACCQCAEPLGLAVFNEDRHDVRCGHCISSPPSFECSHVPLLYEGTVARLVSEFKFDASPRAGHVLKELFLVHSPPRLPHALVPVPLHSARARERGFNQAHWLASQLADEFDLPLIGAKRITNTPSQRSLSRRERFKNIQGAFTVPARIPAHIAIVDDVLTTGSTAHALARAARRAGATTVDVWAVARTKPGQG